MKHPKRWSTTASITKQELARRLHISQMRISRVLNDRLGVSPRLKQDILAQMAKLGYVHDRIAAGLRSRATRTLGLIVPDITNSFFPEITRAIETAAHREGYQIILTQNYESYAEEVQAIALPRGVRVAGLIIAPAGRQKDVQIYHELENRGIPFVFIDRIKRNVDCSYVVTDEEQGAGELGRYLIERGYRRWAYFGGPAGVSSSQDHLRGICRSIKDAGRDPEKMVQIMAGFSEADGHDDARALLAPCRPDVIVCINDPVALGAYTYLKEQNLRVPQDVALTGFSDLKWSGLLEVPLTTVREPTAEIGRPALGILLDQIVHPEAVRQKIKLQPQLVIRQSA